MTVEEFNKIPFGVPILIKLKDGEDFSQDYYVVEKPIGTHYPECGGIYSFTEAQGEQYATYNIEEVERII